jgi:GNAT superfamily N-acetyltransferase
MADIHVVQADLSMAPALTELSAQLGYSMPQDSLAVQLQKILSRRDHQFFVAQIDGTVRGWAHFYIVDLIISMPYVEAAGIVVDADYRQHGIGRALLQQGEAWARAQNIHLVMLRSRTSRKGAHSFYEKLGYECTKESKTFTKILSEQA